MTFALDPQLSIYDIVRRERQSSMVLRDISEMIRVSYQIEERVYQENMQGILFAAFQYLSRFERRRTMYEKLASQVGQMYVFAYPDVELEPIDGLTVVPIEKNHVLMKEWFVIFHGPSYYTGVIAKEVPTEGKRRFDSVWSFDLDIIQIVTDWLASLVDANVMPVMTYDHNAQARIMDDALGNVIGNSNG